MSGLWLGCNIHYRDDPRLIHSLIEVKVRIFTAVFFIFYNEKGHNFCLPCIILSNKYAGTLSLPETTVEINTKLSQKLIIKHKRKFETKVYIENYEWDATI